jgi:hypothetical protein
MSWKHRQRLTVLGQVRDGYKTLGLTAKQIQLSCRRAKRVWRRFEQGGEDWSSGARPVPGGWRRGCTE